jgi:hypothetical protein
MVRPHFLADLIILLTECKGLDQLSGFSIDEAALLLPAREDGTNLRGRATLPNHSVVTFALVRTMYPL